MTHHEIPVAQTPEADNQPVVVAVEKEEQSMPEFTYDPTQLKELSAMQMDAIDRTAWDNVDAGMTPEKVQEGVYEELTALGFNLADAHDGGLVVKYVGIDGKSDTRVINLSATDFGTRIQKAELVAVAPVPEEELLQEAAEEEPVVAEEEANTEKGEVNQEVIAMKTELDQVKAELGESVERTVAQESSARDALTNLYQSANMLKRRLEGHEDYRGALRQVEDILSFTRGRMQQYEGALGEMGRNAQGTNTKLEGATQLARGDKDSAEVLGGSMKAAGAGLEQLKNMQGFVRESGALTMRNLARLDNLIVEMRQGRQRPEVYHEELRAVMTQIVTSVENGKRVQTGLSNMATSLRR